MLKGIEPGEPSLHKQSRHHEARSCFFESPNCRRVLILEAAEIFLHHRLASIFLWGQSLSVETDAHAKNKASKLTPSFSYNRFILLVYHASMPLPFSMVFLVILFYFRVGSSTF